MPKHSKPRLSKKFSEAIKAFESIISQDADKEINDSVPNFEKIRKDPKSFLEIAEQYLDDKIPRLAVTPQQKLLLATKIIACFKGDPNTTNNIAMIRFLAWRNYTEVFDLSYPEKENNEIDYERVMKTNAALNDLFSSIESYVNLFKHLSSKSYNKNMSIQTLIDGRLVSDKKFSQEIISLYRRQAWNVIAQLIKCKIKIAWMLFKINPDALPEEIGTSLKVEIEAITGCLDAALNKLEDQEMGRPETWEKQFEELNDSYITFHCAMTEKFYEGFVQVDKIAASSSSSSSFFRFENQDRVPDDYFSETAKIFGTATLGEAAGIFGTAPPSRSWDIWDSHPWRSCNV